MKELDDMALRAFALYARGFNTGEVAFILGIHLNQSINYLEDSEGIRDWEISKELEIVANLIDLGVGTGGTAPPFFDHLM